VQIGKALGAPQRPLAAIVGGAKLVEFLSDGSPCVSY